MELTIKSRKLDHEFQFIMPDGGGYVRLWTGGGYKQICEGGKFRGSTLRSGPKNFVADCRKWYRAFMRKPYLG